MKIFLCNLESNIKYPFNLDTLYNIYKEQVAKDASIMSDLAVVSEIVLYILGAAYSKSWERSGIENYLATRLI